jgi:glycosyltransferase involved in cell wall biosynthesis
MLHAGGLSVTVLGFRRSTKAVERLDDAPTIDLGLTRDGRLLQRAWAVLRTLVAFGRVRAAVRSADVMMARNLEALVLAQRARGTRRLVFECLDIHRTLVGKGFFSRLIQAADRRAMRNVDLILTSSPRYRDDYFFVRYGRDAPVLLLENKLLVLNDAVPTGTVVRVPDRAPWIIGWLGMLRCARTFEILADIARNSGGKIEVLIAGIPSDDVFTDFPARVAASPGMRYVGPYTSEMLGALYSQVHFVWAIDYFEEGLNSVWLMPTRVYEAMAFGAVPLALRTVETGQWLIRNGVGIVMNDAETEVAALLDALTPTEYASYRSAVAALPETLLRADKSDCVNLAKAVVGR